MITAKNPEPSGNHVSVYPIRTTRPPRAFKAAKDAIPPDRGDDHLDIRSEDIENTNDARGDHGCGLKLLSLGCWFR